MKIQAVKGTRDFYPDQMRQRNWIMDAWRRVSIRNGFEEYDSPIFEYLDLFTIKSGEGIASELFSFTDRGGRQLAIRPETTPALARMVNARINTLSRPIKWFSIQRCCRAEKPQKGRTREFFAWNIDIIGADSVLADAECIYVAVDFLREVGLTCEDIKVCIGSRPLTVAALNSVGVSDGGLEKVLAVLDKRPKVSDQDFQKMCAEVGLRSEQIDLVTRYQDCKTVDEVAEVLDGAAGVEDEIQTLRQLTEYLEIMGASDYCKLDLRIVRGLAYYTGIVYEMLDTDSSLRAVAGGGRYDNLLEVLGGPKVGATGFGMGDVVLGILLDEKDKLPQLSRELDFFVIDDGAGQEQVLKTVGALRSFGLAADFRYKPQAVGKQLKEANRRGAKLVAILKEGSVAVKDLATGAQKDFSPEVFLADPQAVVADLQE